MDDLSGIDSSVGMSFGPASVGAMICGAKWQTHRMITPQPV